MKLTLPKTCKQPRCTNTFTGRGLYCLSHRGYVRVYRVDTSDIPVLLTPKEVCHALGISRDLLDKYTGTKVIKEIRIGNTRRFLKTDVLKLVQQ